MSFNIPNIFVAGTKAKADDVNENFAVLKSEINKQHQSIISLKEEMDSTTDYIENDLFDEILDAPKALKTRFCINYGNLNENALEDLIKFENRIVSFNVGGVYPVLIATNAFGDSDTYEYVDNLDLAGYSNGEYNLFIDSEGVVVALKNKIFEQPNMPSDSVNDDVWFMTMEPNAAYKFNGISWLEYEKTPIGKITIENNEISKVENFRYNKKPKTFSCEWMNIEISGMYKMPHNLNLEAENYRVRVLFKLKENVARWLQGDILDYAYTNTIASTSSEMGFLIICRKDNVEICVGNNPNFSHGGYLIAKNKLQMKVIIKEEKY